MATLKAGTTVPTVAEHKAITTAARRDSDAARLSNAQWRAAKPTARMGRPPKSAPKQPAKLRLDSDVLALLRATGAGWQTRVTAILRERFAL